MKQIVARVRSGRPRLAVALALPTVLIAEAPARPVPPPAVASSGRVCVAALSPDYYSIALVPTRTVPGTQRSSGIAEVLPPQSPFGVVVSANGSYVYNLDIRIQGLTPPSTGAYVGWIAPPDLDSIIRVGAFDETMRLAGRVAFNKFLVIVTLEPSVDETAEHWRGPIIMRGMSLSGLLHTMIGHGPLRSEPCPTYGFR